MLFAYEKTIDAPNDEDPDPIDFRGTYQIQINHHYFTTLYDSVGNVDYIGYVDEQIVDTISLIEVALIPDSLTAQSLITSSFRKETVGMKNVNDTLFINLNESVVWKNDILFGKIWMEQDSLKIDYNWDQSDTWSSGALPDKGEVKGGGVRILN